MKINLKKHNRKIIIAECVWHSFWNGVYITPTIRFDKFLKGCWTLDIIWLKLFITFGYVKNYNHDNK